MKLEKAIDIIKHQGIMKTKPKTKSQSEIREALQALVEAVEKHIPKTPIDKIMYKECPVCGAVDLGRYCMECGQALKWE